MKRILIFIALSLSPHSVFAYECKSGTITSMTLEPKAGGMTAEFFGKARFTVKSNPNDSGQHFYIGEEQQNFETLYSTLMAAKFSSASLEVCWLPNGAQIGLYNRMTRVTLNQ